jgi:hypothetical protein
MSSLKRTHDSLVDKEEKSVVDAAPNAVEEDPTDETDLDLEASSEVMMKAILRVEQIGFKSDVESLAKRRKLSNECGVCGCDLAITHHDHQYAEIIKKHSLCETCLLKDKCHSCDSHFDLHVPGSSVVCGPCILLQEALQEEECFTSVFKHFMTHIANHATKMCNESPGKARTIACVLRQLAFSRELLMCRDCNKFSREGATVDSLCMACCQKRWDAVHKLEKEEEEAEEQLKETEEEPKETDQQQKEEAKNGEEEEKSKE